MLPKILNSPTSVHFLVKAMNLLEKPIVNKKVKWFSYWEELNRTAEQLHL